MACPACRFCTCLAAPLMETFTAARNSAGLAPPPSATAVAAVAGWMALRFAVGSGASLAFPLRPSAELSRRERPHASDSGTLPTVGSLQGPACA